MRLVLLLLSIALAILIFVCSEQEKFRESDFKNMELRTVEPFYYVALFHRGSYDDQEKVRERFYQEIVRQNLNTSGPLMGLFFNDPATVKAEELEWAIAVTVPDSVEVEKPLMTIHWDIPLILSYLYSGKPEDSGPVYAMFDAYIARHNLAPAGPAVERYLQITPSTPLSTDSLQIEIWYAVQYKDSE